MPSSTSCGRRAVRTSSLSVRGSHWEFSETLPPPLPPIRLSQWQDDTGLEIIALKHNPQNESSLIIACDWVHLRSGVYETAYWREEERSTVHVVPVWEQQLDAQLRVLHVLANLGRPCQLHRSSSVQHQEDVFGSSISISQASSSRHWWLRLHFNPIRQRVVLVSVLVHVKKEAYSSSSPS